MSGRRGPARAGRRIDGGRLTALIIVLSVIVSILLGYGIGRRSAVVPGQSVDSGRVSTASRAPAPTSTPAANAVLSESVLLVAAGDIACNPANEKFKDLEGDQTGCRQKATSDLVIGLHPDAVMPLGDNQYQRGTYNGFQLSYGPTWGRFIDITHPVIGNHEYLTAGGAGYFRYFGVLAGDSTNGYYSFDLGSWHIVVLNSQCKYVSGGCDFGSQQEQWLRADLAAHPARCTLAAWHEPRWSSGDHHSNKAFNAFWTDLSAAGVELVLSGHDHDYERFARLDPSGHRNAVRGVRQFVVGTGGVGLRKFEGFAPGSEVRQNTAFGVLALTLTPAGYTWRFVSVGSSFTDSGRESCH